MCVRVAISAVLRKVETAENVVIGQVIDDGTGLLPLLGGHVFFQPITDSCTLLSTM